MICDRCDSDPCTCVTVSEHHALPHPSTVVRSTESALPWGLTLDEFGRDLFDTIKTCSSLMTVDALHIRAIRKEDHLAQRECLSRRQELRARLTAQLAQLSEADRRAIIQRYPVASHV